MCCGAGAEECMLRPMCFSGTCHVVKSAAAHVATVPQASMTAPTPGTLKFTATQHPGQNTHHAAVAPKATRVQPANARPLAVGQQPHLRS